MMLWNHPDDSIYGVTARSEKIVDTMEDLLGGEVYHYHSKITAKEPTKVGLGNGTRIMDTGIIMAVCIL